MSIDVPRTDTEEAALGQAERLPCPFLVLRDGQDRQRIVRLDGDRPLTVGRRAANDVALPWDRQVSRVHAELRPLAGEWTLVDDGLSQNGTYVNEVRLLGRRRLADGDDVRVGRTRMTFRDPAATGAAFTPLPGELTTPAAVSEQQRAILRELCRPFAQDGEHVVAASKDAIADALGLPRRTVQDELCALYGALGIDDHADGTARRELAAAAMATGIVSYQDLL